MWQSFQEQLREKQEWIASLEKEVFEELPKIIGDTQMYSPDNIESLNGSNGEPQTVPEETVYIEDAAPATTEFLAIEPEKELSSELKELELQHERELRYNFITDHMDLYALGELTAKRNLSKMSKFKLRQTAARALSHRTLPHLCWTSIKHGMLRLKKQASCENGLLDSKYGI